jgi:hypothetical protein
MKRILIVLTALVTLTAAFGAPIKDAVIAKILALKAKEFINPAFVKKVVESRHYDFGDTSCDFYSAYYECRRNSYEGIFKESGSDSDESPSWNQYLRLRTIVVAQMKEQLHSGTTLLETYNSCRDAFITTIGAQQPEFRANLIAMIKHAIGEFEKVENEPTRTEVEVVAAIEERKLHGDTDEADLEAMLVQNLSAAETARIVEKLPADSQTNKPESSQNLDMTKFALRRWNEGGMALVKKYLVVLRLAEKDVAGTIQQ